MTKPYSLHSTLQLENTFLPSEDLPARTSQARQNAYNEACKKYDEAMILWKRKQLKAVNSIKIVCEDRGRNFLQGIVLVEGAFNKLEEEFKPKGDASFQAMLSKMVATELYEPTSWKEASTREEC